MPACIRNRIRCSRLAPPVPVDATLALVAHRLRRPVLIVLFHLKAQV